MEIIHDEIGTGTLYGQRSVDPHTGKIILTRRPGQENQPPTTPSTPALDDTIKNGMFWTVMTDSGTITKIDKRAADTPEKALEQVRTTKRDQIPSEDWDRDIRVYDGTPGTGTPAYNIFPDGNVEQIQKDNKMKISKTRLMEIIKEEVANLSTIREVDNSAPDSIEAIMANAEERLLTVASAEEGISSMEEYWANELQPWTVSGQKVDYGDEDPDRPSAEAILGIELSSLGEEDFLARYGNSEGLEETDVPAPNEDETEEEPLVLPDAGLAGVNKSLKRLKQQANDRERRKKLVYREKSPKGE